MKQYFIVFKKQPGEITHAYSIVDEAHIPSVPSEIIHKKVELEDRLYSKEELEELRAQML